MRCSMQNQYVAGVVFLVAGLTAGTAGAGIPECGNLRLEDVGSCEVRGDVKCEAGCEDLGVYKKACATKLRTVCSNVCTLDADVGCTDECTVQCAADCDLGVNVICIHNCFGECAGSCEADCAEAADPAQCNATCEANCDGECDIKCKPLVEGSCYTHCIECCGGSCKAQANMSCQQDCQEEEFEDCEYEVRADCDASCSGSGALFCDGEFAIAGKDLPACGRALLTRGIGVANLEASGEAEVSGGLGGCSTGATSSGTGGWSNFWLLLSGLGVMGMARRSRFFERNPTDANGSNT